MIDTIPSYYDDNDLIEDWYFRLAIFCLIKNEKKEEGKQLNDKKMYEELFCPFESTIL
jgi:hypothetical protein